MKIVVIGGTGRIGSGLVQRLQARGQEAIAAAPQTGVNTLTGEGLAEALDGADAVVDVANSPSLDGESALAFFKASTRTLMAAEAAAGVAHHVALSIVGADRLPASGYLSAKVAQEALIRASGTPYTVVRSTQFFPFIAGIVEDSAVGGATRLSPALMQPIDPAEVVTALADVVVGAPLNATLELAGPEAMPITQIAEVYLRATGDPRIVVADPAAPYFGATLDVRSLTPGPGARLGTTTLADWIGANVSAA